MPADLGIETLAVIGNRHLIDRVDIQRLNHRFRTDIAEQRDLAPGIGGDLAVAAAEQDIRLNADALQFLDRMLGRLGLQLTGRGNPGHQRQMHEQRPLAAEFVAQLADGFEKRQAFDIADRAADLADQEVRAIGIAEDELLDRIGDMGNDLHGAAEIVAAPFLGDHGRIDAAGGDVVALARRNAGEALIVAEVQIGLGAVVGDVDLAVLIRTHRPRIDVEIGIELAQAHLESARLQQAPSAAAEMPLPSEETTPPVINMNRVMEFRYVASSGGAASLGSHLPDEFADKYGVLLIGGWR